MPDPWVTRKQASRMLDEVGCATSVRRLAQMAQNNNEGKGPPFVRIRGHRIRYNVEELRKWAKDNMETIS